MGFGGSTAAANQVLKSNRAMLGKRKKRKLSYVAKDEKFVDHKKASPELLEEIRERLCRRRKRGLMIRVLCTIVGVILVVIVWAVIDWSFIFSSGFSIN